MNHIGFSVIFISCFALFGCSPSSSEQVTALDTVLSNKPVKDVIELMGVPSKEITVAGVTFLQWKHHFSSTSCSIYHGNGGCSTGHDYCDLKGVLNKEANIVKRFEMHGNGCFAYTKKVWEIYDREKKLCQRKNNLCRSKYVSCIYDKQWEYCVDDCERSCTEEIYKNFHTV